MRYAQRQDDHVVQAFENGRTFALERRNAIDCPIPLAAFQVRAAWLDGFEEGRRERGERAENRGGGAPQCL